MLVDRHVIGLADGEPLAGWSPLGVSHWPPSVLRPRALGFSISNGLLFSHITIPSYVLCGYIFTMNHIIMLLDSCPPWMQRTRCLFC